MACENHRLFVEGCTACVVNRIAQAKAQQAQEETTRGKKKAVSRVLKQEKNKKQK